MSEVTIYWASPEAATDRQVRAALSVLDAEERARHDRFRFDRDRRSFALSHALVRRALCDHADGDPREWRFEKGEWGRPSLVPSIGVHFSLSHTAGAIALAVSGVNLGLDVERMLHRRGTLELADDYFAPVEAADVNSCTGPARADRFFRYWTLKESYIKARSMGLAIPLHGFWFENVVGVPTIAFDEHLVRDEPSRWSFSTGFVADVVPLALCVEAQEPSTVSPKQVQADWFCS